MPPTSRTIYNALDALAKPSSHAIRICRACRRSIANRNYASLAAAQAAVEIPPVNSDTEPSINSVVHPQTAVKAGIVLSRPPLITPDPHPFETAYHLYQRRLNERLVLPFTQYFYYRRGTLAFDHWKVRRANRGGAAARDIGKYNAYTDESWNDEVVMGDDCAQPDKILEKLIEEEGRADEFTTEGGDTRLGGLRRETRADQESDQRSLERRLNRTLYLLVKPEGSVKDELESSWTFPSGLVQGKEGLKEAAQRILDQSCGPNMNTWFVGNHPVGHHAPKPRTITSSDQSKQVSSQAGEDEKTFFMKARILAGQADLKLGQDKVQDFKWLSKDEIEKTVSPGYWSSIKNMLVQQ